MSAPTHPYKGVQGLPCGEVGCRLPPSDPVHTMRTHPYKPIMMGPELTQPCQHWMVAGICGLPGDNPIHSTQGGDVMVSSENTILGVVSRHPAYNAEGVRLSIGFSPHAWDDRGGTMTGCTFPGCTELRDAMVHVAHRFPLHPFEDPDALIKAIPNSRWDETSGHRLTGCSFTTEVPHGSRRCGLDAGHPIHRTTLHPADREVLGKIGQKILESAARAQGTPTSVENTGPYGHGRSTPAHPFQTWTEAKGHPGPLDRCAFPSCGEGRTHVNHMMPGLEPVTESNDLTGTKLLGNDGAHIGCDPIAFLKQVVTTWEDQGEGRDPVEWRIERMDQWRAYRPSPDDSNPTYLWQKQVAIGRVKLPGLSPEWLADATVAFVKGQWFLIEVQPHGDTPWELGKMLVDAFEWARGGMPADLRRQGQKLP